MQTKNKSIKLITGSIFYLIGALLAFGLLALSVWGDLEASSFDRALRSDERLRTMRCPVLITEDETGTISARFTNTTDRDVNPTVRARWTEGSVLLIMEQREKIEIPVGESTTYEFEITAEDAAYNALIMASFYQMRNLSLPSRSASCGVVVLPISGPTGQQVFMFTFGTGFLLMAAGLLLLMPKEKLALTGLSPEATRTRYRLKSLLFLGSYFLISVLLSLIGNWLLSIGLMVLAVVSILAVTSGLFLGTKD